MAVAAPVGKEIPPGGRFFPLFPRSTPDSGGEEVQVFPDYDNCPDPEPVCDRVPWTVAVGSILVPPIAAGGAIRRALFGLDKGIDRPIRQVIIAA